MKRTIFRGLAATLLAIAIVVPGHAVPANAFPEILIEKVKELGRKAIIDLVKNAVLGGGGPSAIELALQQIIIDIEASKTEIINHIDNIAASDVRACAKHHVSEFEDIDQFSQSTLESWAQDATACAFLAESRLQSVTSKPAVDEIGFALNVVGPVALAARVKAGFSTTGLMNIIESGNEVLKTKLTPTCTFSPNWADHPGGFGPVEVAIQCTVYGSHTFGKHVWVMAWWGEDPVFVPPSEYQDVIAFAQRQTSRPIAINALALINS